MSNARGWQFPGTGPYHSGYKGNAATASAKHGRVRRMYGPAKDSMCVDCGDQAYDWSQIHGTDGNSVDDYQARCRSCHMKYDHQGDRLAGYKSLGEDHGQHKLTEDDVMIIMRMLDDGRSQASIAKQFGVHQVTISSIKTGKTWSWLTEVI